VRGAAGQGQVLHELEQQTQKSCDRDAGGCGREQHVQSFLEGAPPRAFILQLAWESHNQSSDDIGATMAIIQQVPFRRPQTLRSEC
jgi:hypothetical protein